MVNKCMVSKVKRVIIKIVLVFSFVQLFMTPWTVAFQALLPMGFFSQEYWSGLPFLLQGIFPTQGFGLMSPVSPALQAYSPEASEKPQRERADRDKLGVWD